MISEAIEYARNEWLTLSIYAVVLIGVGHSLLYANDKIPVKLIPVTGLTLFAVAGTLAFLQFREVFQGGATSI